MYTNQPLGVKWSNTLSNQFSVMNGVKQGSVLSPFLFAVNTDRLLERLQQTRVGCHMGSRFTGALAYADDITLLDPCKSVLSILIKVCEDYAAEYGIIFNGERKSKLLYFKGRSSTMVPSEILVNSEIVAISDKTVNLGHTICTKDRENRWPLKTTHRNNLTYLLQYFGQLASFIKIKLFSQFCCSFYGSSL